MRIFKYYLDTQTALELETSVEFTDPALEAT